MCELSVLRAVCEDTVRSDVLLDALLWRFLLLLLELGSALGAARDSTGAGVSTVALAGVGVSTEAFGGVSTAAFDGVSTGAFGGASTGAFGGASTGAFGGASTGASGGVNGDTGTFGSVSTGAFGAASGVATEAFFGGGSTAITFGEICRCGASAMFPSIAGLGAGGIAFSLIALGAGSPEPLASSSLPQIASCLSSAIRTEAGTWSSSGGGSSDWISIYSLKRSSPSSALKRSCQCVLEIPL